MCPQCGKEIETDVCECGFDINETLDCAYKISGNCIKVGDYDTNQ